MNLACRSLLDLLWRPAVSLVSGLHLRRFSAVEADIAQCIADALGLSHREAGKVFRLGLRRYVELGMDFSRTVKYPQHFLAPALENTYLNLSESTSSLLRQDRPILLVTMYMGSFPVGFMKMMQAAQSRKKIFVFKFNAASANEEALFSLFRQTGQDVSPLRAGEEGGKRAFIELRKGALVALMVDAEVHVTSREEVIFFGRPCAMQSGPATLAVLTGAVVLPVINYVDRDGRNVVQVDAPIYPERLCPGEPPRATIKHLSQRIADHMESWIRIDPAQVQRWPSVAAIMRNAGVTHEESVSS